MPIMGHARGCMLTLKEFKTIQLRANEKTKDIIKILGIYTEDLENYINMQNQE